MANAETEQPPGALKGTHEPLCSAPLLCRSLVEVRSSLEVQQERFSGVSVHSDAASQPLQAFLQRRYDAQDAQRRLPQLVALLDGAVEQQGFAPSDAIALVLSPGRDRVFMGHSDSPGLGGHTVNAATTAEIAAVVAAGGGAGILRVSNADSAAFPTLEFALADLLAAADAVDALLPSGCTASDAAADSAAAEALQAVGRAPGPLAAHFAGRDWGAYVASALTVLLSRVSPHAPQLRAWLAALPRGLRLHVGSCDLPSTGGVSSSAALTGALSVGLGAFFGATWSRAVHTRVDLAEYLLGKTAGVADKTAQVFARRGAAALVGSFPEQYLGSVPIPATHYRVFMAACPTPRITTTAGAAALEAVGGLDVPAITAWGAGVMEEAGSHAYVLAERALAAALYGPQARLEAAGVGAEDAARLRAALYGAWAGEGLPPPSFLRQLAAGGGLEDLPVPARHALVFRALTLVPEHVVEEAEGGVPRVYAPRAAALYGVAECERGAVFVAAMHRLAALPTGGDADAAVATALRCVSVAHDGDRALEDAWAGGAATAWALASAAEGGAAGAAHVSDAALAKWAADPTAHPLQWRPGSFRRSLPSIDGAADECAAAFAGRAALRVAAAGLGGFVALHAAAGVAEDAAAWLLARGWSVREVKPGAPTAVLAAPGMRGALEEVPPTPAPGGASGGAGGKQ